MALRTPRRRAGGSALSLFGLMLAVVLSGCNGAIEAYRSVSGMNKNDPDPATAPFTQNLAESEAGPYPNLATVPPPPTIATTLADREKLAQNLTGTRTATEANGGSASPGPVPPPPPIPETIAAPQNAPPPVKDAARTPAPPMRKQDEPPTPQPLNTTMQAPTITSLPGVEAPRPTPPQGHVAAMPRPDSSQLAPAAAQSANPLPTPPPATLPPPQIAPQVAALPPPKLPPVPMTVAAFDVAADATTLPGDVQPQLAGVVTQYNSQPRTVRIVSYATPGSGGAEQLNSFRGALDHAQLVAKALAGAGIPTKQIQTQAAPSNAQTPAGRIEIQFLPQ